MSHYHVLPNCLKRARTPDCARDVSPCPLSAAGANGCAVERLERHLSTSSHGHKTLSQGDGLSPVRPPPRPHHFAVPGSRRHAHAQTLPDRSLYP